MSRQTLAKILIAASLSTSICGLAVAQQHQRRGPGQGQGQQREGDGGSGGGGSGGGERRQRPSADQCFERADTNSDNALSREEFTKWFNNRPPPPPPR